MQQTASNFGTSNAVVQIVGDNNNVAIGNYFLKLTRFSGRRHIRQDLDRLSPYTRSIPLIGREDELASLRAFLNDQRSVLARVLVGSGGSGKTRLALELCEEFAGMGWDTGFVTGTELSRFFSQQNLSRWEWNKPILIVVDYAAEHAALLGKWLDELADRSESELPKHPLRLLLLERNANTELGWWTTVFGSDWGSTHKQRLLDPAEPVPIRPLRHPSERLALLTAMVSQVAPAALPEISPEETTNGDKIMQVDWGGDPLFLMMAALAMTQLGHTNALTLGRTDLARGLAKREAGRLQQLAGARGLDKILVQHLAACVTLAQGMSREAFEDFAAQEKQAIARPSGGDAAHLADLLLEAFPHPDGIAPLLPDLIAEAFLVSTFYRKADISTVLRCHERFGRRVTESVIRCVQDFAQQSHAPIEWLDAILDSVKDDFEALAVLANSLPVGSVALRELNLRVAKRLNELCATKQDASMQLCASTLHNLALAQAMAGDREAALHTAKEAVDIRRKLADQQPDVFRSSLAGSLHNLAGRLSDLGQREPALHAGQEAVNIYRELAAEQPEEFLHNLALSLTSLANRLGDLGQREPALHAAQEAVNILRELAAQRPDVFRPDLALSLNNLTGRLSDLDQHELALHVANETVNIRRELAAHRPDVYRPQLAASLNNLSNRLGGLGQRESALHAAQEAVDIRRELAAQGPEVFQPDLALSLNNLANRLSALGRRELALRSAQEAVGLYRELATRRPAVFRAELAGSLNNLANRLNGLGHHQPALHTAQEAVDIYRELAEQHPDVFRPYLARSLNNLANRLGGLDMREPALHAIEEAVKIFQELVVERPAVFRSELAGSLHNLANSLSGLGHLELALHAAQEAVEIRRELASQRPEVFRPQLARSLNNLASRLSGLGQHESALHAAQEAVDIRRELSTESPAVFRPDLALSLHNLSNRFANLNQEELALQAAQEAVDIRRELACKHLNIFGPELVRSLNNLGIRLSNLGFPALDAAQEAVNTCRELQTERPDAFERELAESLFILALRTREVRNASEALPHAKDAITTLQPLFLQDSGTDQELMAMIVKLYVQLCDALECQLDHVLLEPLLPYLTNEE